MNLKRHLLETATLIAAAASCAFVANQMASRDRKLALPGHYESATTVPAAPDSRAQTPDAATSVVSQPPSSSTTFTPTASPSFVPALSATPVALPPASPSKATVRSSPAPSSSRPSAPAVAAPSSAEGLTRRFPPHPDKPFVEAAGADVAWLQARGALFLDARRTSVFQEGHIAGARPISVWEADVDEKVMALVNEGRDLQQPVVIYCSGGDCEDSHMLAQKLFGAGFNNLLVYKDGWPDWQKRGGPSRTGMES